VKRSVGMIHVLPENVMIFGRLAGELVPGVEVQHFLDTSLPTMSAPASRPEVINRLQTYASFASRSGSEAVLLTCTAFGRLVEEVSSAVDCPVLSVLEIMVDEALKQHGRIGIVGSHPCTVAGAERLVRERATQEGRALEVEARHCPGAFDAMRNGDWETHDRVVLENLRELVQRVDVVVAPQASLERAIVRFKDARHRVPILTSSRLSVARLRDTVERLD